MTDEFISVYAKATGRKQEIPAHWLDHPKMMAPFEKTPLQRQADAAGDLKGKALAKALDDAGLTVTGTADEKRAALQAFRTEQAALEVIAANDDLHDGPDEKHVVDAPTDPLAPITTDTPHGGDTEGA